MATKKVNKETEESGIILEGLETAEGVNTTGNIVKQDKQIDWTSIDFLYERNPRDFRDTDLVVPAYKDELEEKIMEGLKVLETFIERDAVIVDPMIMLLAKWWQVKPARAALKKMISEDVEKRGLTFDLYMNLEVNKQVEALKKLDYGIGRIKAMTTFFKPRDGKDIDREELVRIDGKVYSVKMSIIVEAKYNIKGSDERKAFLLQHATPAEFDVVEDI